MPYIGMWRLSHTQLRSASLCLSLALDKYISLTTLSISNLYDAANESVLSSTRDSLMLQRLEFIAGSFPVHIKNLNWLLNEQFNMACVRINNSANKQYPAEAYLAQANVCVSTPRHPRHKDRFRVHSGLLRRISQRWYARFAAYGNAGDTGLVSSILQHQKHIVGELPPPVLNWTKL